MVAKLQRLSRDDISALLARPAVMPGARDTHVVALAPDALLEGRTPNDVLREIVEAVAAPRV